MKQKKKINKTEENEVFVILEIFSCELFKKIFAARKGIFKGIFKISCSLKNTRKFFEINNFLY